MKIVSPLTLICALLGCSFSQRSFSQDIALNKPYTVSAKANFDLASKDPDNKQLTDGVYTKSSFVTSNTTVGWYHVNKLVIEIDLAQVSDVNGISFNTTRVTAAGYGYPQDVFVFTSNDQKSYTYVGDVINDLSDVEGAYKIKKFTLSGLDQSARYVRLVVIPTGSFLFCDEIEVLGSSSASGGNKGPVFDKTDLDAAVDSLTGARKQYKKLTYQLKRVQDFDARSASSSDTLDLSRDNGSNASLQNKLHNDSVKRLSLLKKKLKKDIVVDKVNTWVVLPDPYVPKGAKDNSYNITTEINGVQYGSFVVTNLYTDAHDISCCVQNNSPDVAGVQLFTVPFVESGALYKKVADPLVPYSGAITLPPGESRMFFFKISGAKAGQAQNSIQVQSGAFSTSLPLNITVANISFGRDFSLNADNWAYLNYPLIADRQDAAIADLHDHHINTMVIPPTVLPVVGSTDFTKFDQYIAKVKSFHIFFLHMDFTSQAYKNSFQATPLLSDQWKSNFLQWYDQVVKDAAAAGVSASQLYIYPYDEIVKENIPAYTGLLNWLHQARPDIKAFATLPSTTAMQQLLPLVSIAQFHNVKYLTDIVNSAEHDVWFYETSAHSEALPMNGYYRMFGWNAFFDGYQGVGFWNYADASGKLELDQYDGVNGNNYSVIYHGPGTEIISSRRWEAFKLGIEDYELLKMYAAKVGMDNAKSLAKSVLDNKTDVTMADQARDQMLKALAQ